MAYSGLVLEKLKTVGAGAGSWTYLYGSKVKYNAVRDLIAFMVKAVNDLAYGYEVGIYDNVDYYPLYIGTTKTSSSNLKGYPSRIKAQNEQSIYIAVYDVPNTTTIEVNLEYEDKKVR